MNRLNVFAINFNLGFASMSMNHSNLEHSNQGHSNPGHLSLGRSRLGRLSMSLCLLLLSNISFADEIRPAYLELNQHSTNTFSVLWKLPQNKNLNRSAEFSLTPRFPENCKNKTEITSQQINGAILQRWYIHCDNSIIGQRISINNIDKNNTEILLRLKWLDETVATTLLKTSKPFYEITENSSTSEIAATYLMLGIEHILLGFDHLLFVFALLLIVKNTRQLLITITAFTIAHSITLAGATLGWIHVAQQPVEAVIALSILFLAMEIVHSKRGNPGAAARWPWLIAFIFGLLHGFGFAGALAEIGLPQQAIPLALVFFNVGVELGQLLFVAIVLLLGWLLHHLKQAVLLEKAETVAVYAIGSLSSFWLFERISAF